MQCNQSKRPQVSQINTTNVSHKYKKVNHKRVAYFMSRSAYRSCWIKYGVNPSLDPKYRIYQPIVIHTQQKRRIEEQQEGENGKMTYDTDQFTITNKKQKQTADCFKFVI